MKKFFYKIDVNAKRLRARVVDRGRQKENTKVFLNGDQHSIYHIHIRKTGGTSLNHALVEAITGQNSDVIMTELENDALHRINAQDRIITGWSQNTINRYPFNYGFSHLPIDQLKLPENVFTYTCFRDPVQRLHSHYKMLRGFLNNGINEPCVILEGDWATGSFLNFVERTPRKDRDTQLYMFSSAFNIQEAIENVKKCNHIMFFNNIKDDVAELSEKLGIELQLPLKNKSMSEFMLSDNDDEYVREILKDEYEFYDLVKNEIYETTKVDI